MNNSYELRSKSRQSRNLRTVDTSVPSQRPSSVDPFTSGDHFTPNPDSTQGFQQTTSAMQDPTATSIKDLQKSFSDFSNKVCAKLDVIHSDISAMKKKMSDLEATAEDNSARMLNIEKEKLPQMEKRLQDEIDALKEKLLLSEIYQRKSNLLFYGLEKKENENVSDVLRAAFVSLGLTHEEAESVAIINAHRLPSKRQTSASGNAPEPIIAKFVYMAQRNRLLAAFERRHQRSSSDQPHARISVRTDLPPILKAQRGVLATIAYKFRKEDNLSTKIVVVGTKVIIYTKRKDSTEWQRYKE